MDKFIQQLLASLNPDVDSQSSANSASATPSNTSSATQDQQIFDSAFDSAIGQNGQTSGSSNVSNFDSGSSSVTAVQISDQAAASLNNRGYDVAFQPEIEHLNQKGQDPSQYGHTAESDGVSIKGIASSPQDRSDHYENVKSDGAINEAVLKAKLIKDGQTAGMPQKEVKGKIDAVETNVDNKLSGVKPDLAHPTSQHNPYQTEYDKNGGAKNTDPSQKVLKDQAQLYDLENKDHQQINQAGHLAGKSDKQINGDILERQQRANNKLGVGEHNQSQAQNATEAQNQSASIAGFEQQYGLTNNSANNYLSQIVLNAQQGASGANVTNNQNQLGQSPNLVAVTTTYNQLHQQDTQNGVAGAKDDQISQVLTNSATNLFQNQNQQNTGVTLTKYNNDNKQMTQTLQNQAQTSQQKGHQADTTLEK